MGWTPHSQLSQRQPSARTSAWNSLWRPAGARPTLHAGAGVELRGLSIRKRALAAAQDEAVVGHCRRVAAEHVVLRQDNGIVTAGREPQPARAFEFHRRPTAIAVVLDQQDAELVTRPSGPVLAV